MTSPHQLDSGWISTGADQDGDYPNPDGPPMGRAFMNRETGEFIEVEREAGEPSDSWLITVPDHRQHHKVAGHRPGGCPSSC